MKKPVLTTTSGWFVRKINPDVDSFAIALYCLENTIPSLGGNVITTVNRLYSNITHIGNG